MRAKFYFFYKTSVCILMIFIKIQDLSGPSLDPIQSYWESAE